MRAKLPWKNRPVPYDIHIRTDGDDDEGDLEP
jgi:hypothetical protein